MTIPETSPPQFEKETSIDFVVAQGSKFLLESLAFMDNNQIRQSRQSSQPPLRNQHHNTTHNGSRNKFKQFLSAFVHFPPKWSGYVLGLVLACHESSCRFFIVSSQLISQFYFNSISPFINTSTPYRRCHLHLWRNLFVSIFAPFCASSLCRVIVDYQTRVCEYLSKRVNRAQRIPNKSLPHWPSAYWRTNDDRVSCKALLSVTPV